MPESSRAGKRQKRKMQPPRPNSDNASLYPLTPEQAIRAILGAGPHRQSGEGENRPKNKPEKR
jgi:hypothetical protein